MRGGTHVNVITVTAELKSDLRGLTLRPLHAPIESETVPLHDKGAPRASARALFLYHHPGGNKPVIYHPVAVRPAGTDVLENQRVKRLTDENRLRLSRIVCANLGL